MNIYLITTLLSSFILTYFSIPPIVRVSNMKQLFDFPNARKLNKVVVPTLGGIAIFIGLMLSSIIFMKGDVNPGSGIRQMLASVIILFFIGLKDDLIVMSARKKLFVQIAVALLLTTAGNFRISHASGLFSLDFINAWISIPLTAVIILFLINAVNLIDGIDGLAGGLTLLFSTFMGIWFSLCGNYNYAVFCLALSGSLIAFLRFNLWGGKNKVFMGDTGSLILGVFVAAIAIKFNELNITAPAQIQFAKAPLIILALLIVPITDTTRVFAIRIWHKQSPFSPDMNHFHHLLIKLRMSHIQASLFLISYTVFFGLLALTFSHSQVNITTGFVSMLSLSYTIVGLLYLKTRSISSPHQVMEKQFSYGKTIQMAPTSPLKGMFSSAHETKPKPVLQVKKNVLQANE